MRKVIMLKTIIFALCILYTLISSYPYFYVFSSHESPISFHSRYSLFLVQNQHVCILLMSEPEQNQQAEVVQVDHHQAEGGAPTHNSEIKEEGTVALEISQLGESVSSGHHSQIHSQEITVEAVEPKEIVVTKSEGEKVEETVVLVTSAIQSESGSVVLQDEKKQVKVESKVNEGENEPHSPINYRNSETLVLSPRSSSKRSASPAVYKGKLDTVVKMLNKQEDKGRDLEDQLNQLTFKKLEVQKALNEKILTQKSFKERQEEEEKLNQERGQLKSTVAEKQALLEHLKQRKSQEQALHQVEIEKIRQENARLQHQLQNKKKSEQQQQQEHQAALANAKSALEAEQKRLAHIQDSHNVALGQKQTIAKKIADLNGQKQVVQANIANAKSSASEKAQAEQQAKADLLKKIAEVKQKINNKKNELTQAKGQNHDDLKTELQKVSQEVQSVRNVSQNLIQSNKQLEEQISKKSKEVTENKEAEKKKQKRIIDLSKRSEQLSKKLNDLKEESTKLDTQKQEKKAVRYEEKVPEEFLAAQAKNDAIRKEIKKINQKYDLERSELDKLVPPSVIENMNKKISAVISNNQRATEIVKIIEQVTKENEKLGVEIDSLEWGENNYLKDLEYERKKQDEKNKALEEELQTKKKQLQQLTFKLDEYVKEYPDFKPEKKKKPEPQPEPKAKKEEKGKKNDKSPPAEELKKKKSIGVEGPMPKLEQVKVEKVVEAKVEEPKAGKNKKKKGSASEIIEIKADSPPAVEMKVQVKPEKNKVEVKSEVRSEIKAEPKVEPKAEQKVQAKQGENKPKKKKK